MKWISIKDRRPDWGVLPIKFFLVTDECEVHVGYMDKEDLVILDDCEKTYDGYQDRITRWIYLKDIDE